MDIFSWLLVGHLVGDWLLQNDWMAKGKRGGLVTKAGLTHFAVYTTAIATVLKLLGLAQKSPIAIVAISVLIFVSHWFIDATDIVDRWMRLYQQSQLTIVRMMVDQTFHLLVLAGVAFVWQQLY
jgi:hypothetical protein